MRTLQVHLTQSTTELASVPTGAGAVELRAALAVILLIAVMAAMSQALETLRRATEIFVAALKTFLLVLLAGLVVAAVVISAFTDLLAG